MKKSEAAKLLGHAAAFDNRTVGEVDATAWASALHDVPLDDDATAAVARYYGTPPTREGERLWIQPHHVKSGRLAIRQERLGTTLPGYVAPAELETGAEFIARRQRQIDDVAAGRIPARPVPLKGGMPRELRTGLAALGWQGLDDERGLAAVGRTLTAESSEQARLVRTVRRPGPLGIECPECAAPIGRPCKTLRNRLHGARRLAAEGKAAARRESADDVEARRAGYLAQLAGQARRDDLAELAEWSQYAGDLAQLAERAQRWQVAS
ncbi:hypothetical protein VWBp16 [Streptomyces phage VWB]|uniref:DNA-binding phage zinc finger domain-containing protein n=1 Tax=Streptomyces phage VWB TaxID=10702 RepID=Q6VY73_9CAUD|nr:hypothetical protein VWBp16 [Streptomyces phage VWB]AAR29706.1 hypothetical protein [Streptomyces phage VWB]